MDCLLSIIYYLLSIIYIPGTKNSYILYNNIHAAWAYLNIHYSHTMVLYVRIYL